MTSRPTGARRRLRRLAASVALLAAVSLAVPVTITAVSWTRADTSNVGQLDFARELRIPRLLQPKTDATGRKVFDLKTQEATSELIAGKRTATWGFNGSYLGPTLRASRGDQIYMRVTNGLRQATTVHWHGMHLPAKADGGPHQPIEPGETWTPSWRVDQPAATLWYHPHLHGTTTEHVYRGLAGMFILDDPAASKLALPQTYGVDDIPLIVQDKRFEDSGELSFSRGMISSPIGQLGDTILVNGTANPHLNVSSTRVRLRLLNASGARSYNYGFSDDRKFDLIATEGGLLGAPARLERVQLSPGERAEIVVAFKPGDNAILRSFKPDLGSVGFFNARFSGADDTFDILELRATDKLTESPPVPRQLVPRDSPDPSMAQRVRRFELGSRDINDLRMDMNRIDQVVALDTTEIWEVTNESGTPHNFHVHGTRFKILRYAGKAPPPALSGLKDTVFVPPDETVRLATRFTDHSDPATPYMFHCHLLRHEDRGMMGQFVVVKPGENSVRRIDQDDPGH